MRRILGVVAVLSWTGCALETSDGERRDVSNSQGAPGAPTTPERGESAAQPSGDVLGSDGGLPPATPDAGTDAPVPARNGIGDGESGTRPQASPGGGASVPAAPGLDAGAGTATGGAALGGGSVGGSVGGSTIADPCETSMLGVARSPISETEARALGFGEKLAAFSRTFLAPLAWTRIEERPGWPAPSGYDASTMVDVEMHVAAIEHAAPRLAGCQDRIEVTVALSLHTQDGALSIAGQAAGRFDRSATSGSAVGSFDLKRATGTLRVEPPAAFGESVAQLGIGLSIWPETVRGHLSISFSPITTSVGAGLPAASWRPLEGRFPIDDCFTHQRPFEATTVSSALSDRSPDEWRTQLAAILHARSPAQGRWTDGTNTMVTAEIGGPMVGMCQERRALSYQVPLLVRSDDGRVHIEAPARALLALTEDGALENVWFEIYRETPIPVQSLASEAGISGLDLASFKRVFWHTELYLVTPPHDHGPRGQVTVEAVGTVAGVSDDAVLGVVAELTWSLAAPTP